MNTDRGHIAAWLRTYRPELTAQKDKDAIIDSTLNSLEPLLQDLRGGGRSIVINEHLVEHYYYSAYNLMKQVFKEKIPNEYEMYQQTPIFYEIITEMVENAVNEGLFSYAEEVVGKASFEDQALKDDLLPYVKKAIA